MVVHLRPASLLTKRAIFMALQLKAATPEEDAAAYVPAAASFSSSARAASKMFSTPFATDPMATVLITNLCAMRRAISTAPLPGAAFLEESAAHSAAA